MRKETSMDLRRTTLIITQKCTLKCKLCLAFIPYYKNPAHFSYESTCKVIDNYFKLVNNVEIFSITGGEPLLHPDLIKIMEKVLEYRCHILNSIDIVTNGTIMFSEELWECLEKNKCKIRIIISDYGRQLSPYVEEIEMELKQRKVNYRVQHYDNDVGEWTYNGWVDFRDHRLKHHTEQKKIEQAKRCIFRKGHYWVINDGELHPCSRQYWRMYSGVLERDKEWYIDLKGSDLDLNIEQKKLAMLESVPYLKSCAYCNGVYEGIERHRPAEQL